VAARSLDQLDRQPGEACTDGVSEQHPGHHEARLPFSTLT
jgi:hypothetical protein